MKNFNKILTIFLFNICGIFFLLTLLQYFKILEQNFLVSTKLAIFVTFLSFLLIFLQYFENANKERKERAKEKLKKIFPIALSLQALFSFLVIVEMEFLTNEYIFPYILLMITVAFLWTHKEEIREKKQDMGLKHAMFFLIAILIVFTFVKAPHFENNFTGAHPMKYGAYVEPALYMAKNDDFTKHQRKYYADPINNPEGFDKALPSFPAIQWSLASMLKIFPNSSIELITRIFMHLVGVIFLIFAFLFTKSFINNTFALIYILLLGTNPIVAFSTYLTVYDSFNMMLLFISLFLLAKYLKNRENTLLIGLAGLFIGLGVAAKVSILIWALPLIIIFIFFKSPTVSTKIFDFITYMLFVLITYFTIKFATSRISLSGQESLALLFAGISFFICFFKILHSKKEDIILKLDNLQKRKSFLPTIILFIGIMVLFSYSFFFSTDLIENFLADKKLLFNLDMYLFMIKNYLIPYTTLPIILLSASGYVLLLFEKSKSLKILTFTFLITAVFFLFIASKSIFFHSYYYLFIISAVLISSSYTIYKIKGAFKDTSYSNIFLILVFILILPAPIKEIDEHLGAQAHDFGKALAYLKENTEEGDFFLDDSGVTYFTLYSDTKRVGDLVMLEDKKFKESVRGIGFGDTMRRYNIKYLISFHAEPEYEKYANIFSEEELLRPSYRRSDLILSVVNPEKYHYFEDLEEREEIVKIYDLKNKFVLEKQIGAFKFFRFEN